MEKKKGFILIIGIYTIIQLIILLGFGYTPYPDSQGYITCAHNALSYNQFYPAKETLYTLPFLWNIGAINTVAVSLKLFHSVTPVLIIYILLKGGTLYLVYLITHKWFGEKNANITCLIYLLYPANYGEGTSLLSEVPFVFFCLAGIYASIKGSYLMGGLLLGCADYFRPIAIIFILALILCQIRNYKGYLKICLGYALVINTIGFCNYYSKGEYIYKAKTGWMALAQYHWDNDGEQKGIKPMDLTDNHHLTFSQKDEMWRNMFLDWLKEHKMKYIQQIPVKIGKTYISDNVNMCAFLNQTEKKKDYMYDSLSINSMLHSFPKYSLAQWITLYNLIYYYGIIITFILSFKYIRKLKIAWFVVLIGTTFIALLGHGEARFHIPYMPFIIMCSAYYISYYKKQPDIC